MRFFTFPSSRRGVWRRSFFLLLGVSTLTVAAAFAREAREWRDSKGRPIMTSTNEKLVGTLRLDDDSDPTKARIRMGAKTFRFPLAKLSEADREYVEAERAKKNASQTASTRTPGADSDSDSDWVSAENASRTLTTIPQDGVKRALLVGVDDYAEFADLKYAVADVEAIRERLVELGFKPENIVELKSTNPANLRPSRRYISRQVDALLKAAGPNDLLFLHFSGHGFQLDDVARFAPEDAGATGDEQVIDPETTISLTEIMDRLRKSDAKFKWMIVDACRENPTETRSAAASARALKNINPPKGMLVLQSCSEGELSYEDADAGRGLFTARLLEAFEGKADFDGDGKMSALDVCKYVSEQTLAASKTRFNATQTPRASAVDFADFAVAEDLKVDGLTREDRARAQTYYDEAFASAQAKKFEEAKAQIAAALEIVADVAETDPAKKRYLERQAMIEMLANAGTSTENIAKLDSPTTKTNDEFGKPNKFVSTVEQLEYAVENVEDGDIIQLARGDYTLTKKLVVPNGCRMFLVGATRNQNDVRLFQPSTENDETNDAVITVEEGGEIGLADMILESKNRYALISNNGYEYNRSCKVTAFRCKMCAPTRAMLWKKGEAVLRNCEFIGTERSAVRFFETNTDAEECDFNGGVDLSVPSSLKSAITSTFKNCKFYNAEYTGLDISGDKETRLMCCNVIDCEIYDCDSGLRVENRAQVVVEGGKIYNCRDYEEPRIGCAVRVAGDEGGKVDVKKTVISNCDKGFGVTENGQCQATDITLKSCATGIDISAGYSDRPMFIAKDFTFTDVNEEWDIYDATGNRACITYNGQTIKDDN